jgi:hypothetical protein
MRRGKEATVGFGLLITLEREIPGVDPDDFAGRAVAAARHDLESIAQDLDLPGLGEFVSFGRAEAEALAEDMKFDTPTAGKSTARWFSSARGLEVVRALTGHLEKSPDEVNDPDAVLEELRAVERILEAAERESVGFRLSVDY